ncbi:hypothetical protein HSX11_03125 [Oxalobacteraceae bacterium]|nr:hypothetical protein [Oxalobacteraceae bacterium]
MKSNAIKKPEQTEPEVPVLARPRTVKAKKVPERIILDPPGKNTIPLSVIRRAVANAVARHKK